MISASITVRSYCHAPTCRFWKSAEKCSAPCRRWRWKQICSCMGRVTSPAFCVGKLPLGMVSLLSRRPCMFTQVNLLYTLKYCYSLHCRSKIEDGGLNNPYVKLRHWSRCWLAKLYWLNIWTRLMFIEIWFLLTFPYSLGHYWQGQSYHTNSNMGKLTHLYPHACS